MDEKDSNIIKHVMNKISRANGVISGDHATQHNHFNIHLAQEDTPTTVGNAKAEPKEICLQDAVKLYNRSKHLDTVIQHIKLDPVSKFFVFSRYADWHEAMHERIVNAFEQDNAGVVLKDLALKWPHDTADRGEEILWQQIIKIFDGYDEHTVLADLIVEAKKKLQPLLDKRKKLLISFSVDQSSWSNSDDTLLANLLEKWTQLFSERPFFSEQQDRLVMIFYFWGERRALSTRVAKTIDGYLHNKTARKIELDVVRSKDIGEWINTMKEVYEDQVNPKNNWWNRLEQPVRQQFGFFRRTLRHRTLLEKLKNTPQFSDALKYD